jgi:hypothetical protein
MRFGGWSLVLFASALIGCASPWEGNFQPNPDLGGVRFAPTDTVQIRTIEYERFAKFAGQERQRRIVSTTAPQDMPPAERMAEKGRLLEALQIPLGPEDAIVLGWSEFTVTENLNPNSRELRHFAIKMGADFVVVTSVFRGPVTTIVREPITTYSYGYSPRAVGRRGRGGAFPFSYTSTTWVPIQVMENSYFFQVFFIRRVRPGDRVD